jgi:hypothetical protein
MIGRRTRLTVLSLFSFGFVYAFNPNSIVISPTTFDFGWCPDNAKINAEFTIRNTSSELIPITGVQPTCGCTASEFNPGTLGSNEESKVVLTFNTRGYANTPFNKNAKIKTDSGGAEYTVDMKGFVLDPKALVAPEGDGIAGFDPGTKEKKKTITVKNRSSKDVTLKVVQPAAAWADVKFDAQSLKAGETATIAVQPDGSFDQERVTSMTVEASDGTATSRFTVAIRTGTPPPPTRRPGASVPTSPKTPSDKK